MRASAPDRDRRRRPQLDRGPRGRARRSTTRGRRSPAPTTPTGSGVELDGVELYPRPGPHDRHLPHPRRPQRRDRRCGRRTSSTAVRADIEGALRWRPSRSPPASRRACARGRRVEPLPRHAPAPQPLPHRRPARAGRSPATPATTRTRSWRSGIGDAFRDAELLAEAIEDGDLDALRRAPRRARPARASRARSQFAALQPPSAEQQALFAVLRERPGADRPLLRDVRGHGRARRAVQPRRRRSWSVKRRGTAASSPSS